MTKPRKKRGRKKKRKPNAGSFKPNCPRTVEMAKRGYRAALDKCMTDGWAKLAWFHRHLRQQLKKKGKHHGQEEDRDRTQCGPGDGPPDDLPY